MITFGDRNSHSEIHQLVPQDFAVNRIISSNGTIGEVDGEIIFKHGLSLAQVQQITNLAKRNKFIMRYFLLKVIDFLKRRK